KFMRVVVALVTMIVLPFSLLLAQTSNTGDAETIKTLLERIKQLEERVEHLEAGPRSDAEEGTVAAQQSGTPLHPGQQSELTTQNPQVTSTAAEQVGLSPHVQIRGYADVGFGFSREGGL